MSKPGSNLPELAVPEMGWRIIDRNLGPLVDWAKEHIAPATRIPNQAIRNISLYGHEAVVGWAKASDCRENPTEIDICSVGRPAHLFLVEGSAAVQLLTFEPDSHYLKCIDPRVLMIRACGRTGARATLQEADDAVRVRQVFSPDQRVWFVGFGLEAAKHIVFQGANSN